MKSLGTLLVKHGWITKQQLGLAISKQREIGGRLGTCLLEMGAISEDLLDRSLAEQQGVPVASAEDLEDVSETVYRMLPAPIAIRYRALPFRATHGTVDIAMLEVDNLWLQDELSFIVGRRLNAYIANEARMVEALTKYYGAPCSERFVQLLTQLNRRKRRERAADSHPDSKLLQPRPQRSMAADWAPPREEIAHADKTESPLPPAVDASSARTPAAPLRKSIPLTQHELESLGTRPLSHEDPEMFPSVAEIYSRDLTFDVRQGAAEAEVALDSATDPEAVGRILLGALAQKFVRVLLFKASSTGVKAWMAHGRGVDRARFGGFELPFDRPSIFLNIREGGSFFVGILPKMQAHLELAECLGTNLADECAVFPIRVQNRLVSLFYADRGPLGLADLDLESIRGLTAIASRAFERYIVERKKRRKKGSRTG